MRRFFRGLALATVGLYFGLIAAETFHGHAKNHAQSQCAICQVAHQTPAAAQPKPVLQPVPESRPLSAFEPEHAAYRSRTAYSGLSPPVL